MLSAVVLIQALLASVVLATAGTREDRLAGRRQQRAARRHGPLRHTTTENSELIADTTAPFDNPNWAGAAFTGYPNGTFTGVKGTLTVPTVSVPEGGSGPFAAVAWVGIDGATCDSAIWQTGIEFSIDKKGKVEYSGWYEWWPNEAVTFHNLSFSFGDEVALTITVDSPTSGTALIENLTNGQKGAKTFVDAKFPLCQQNAEWIVEDFEQDDGGQVAFANFSKVVFTKTSATSTLGTLEAGTATPFDIVQNNVTLTDSTVSHDSVSVSRI